MSHSWYAKIGLSMVLSMRIGVLGVRVLRVVVLVALLLLLLLLLFERLVRVRIRRVCYWFSSLAIMVPLIVRWWVHSGLLLYVGR